MPLLEISEVSLGFGGLQVLNSLDMSVAEGEILSVIGPNGAGKTTLFNLITGVYEPDSGDVRFDGQSIVGLDPHRINNMGIARTFQNLRLFLNMTVKENVLVTMYGRNRAGIAAGALGLPRARREERAMHQRAEELLSFFGTRLQGYRFDQPAYSLSYANRRRLEIARALATAPRLLLVDEPAAGMNPTETHEITELIGRLRTELGLTILIIEHDMHVVEGVSDRVVALDYGVKIAEGSFSSVATDPAVIEAYLARARRPNERRHVGQRRTAAAAQRRQHVLRADPHPPRRDAGGRTGRARVSARRQRQWEVDHAEDHPRVGAGVQRFGHVRRLRRDPLRHAAAHRRRDGRGAREPPRLFAPMTVLENLEMGAYLRSDDLSDDFGASTTCSRCCTHGASSSPARCRGASSRCWRWAGR